MPTQSSDPPDIDPAAATKAFNAMAPRFLAIAKDAVVQVNTDLQDAAIRALSVARFVATADAKARFALLSKELFDPQHLTDLEPLALATYHVSIELRAARATSTEAKLPVKLVDDAVEVKERMISLCAYVFASNKKLSAEVADIRAGSGYKDLASDLGRLAKIYADEKSTVQKDAFNYRSTDEKKARTLAQRILTELGEAQGKEEAKWADLGARSFTELRSVFEEISAAGRFIYRHEEPEKKFPSLYTANRGRPRKGGGGEGEEPKGGTGGTGTGG